VTVSNQSTLLISPEQSLISCILPNVTGFNVRKTGYFIESDSKYVGLANFVAVNDEISGKGKF